MYGGTGTDANCKAAGRGKGSRPIPIPFATKSSGILQKKSVRYSTIIPSLLSRRSLTRGRSFNSRGTVAPKRVKAVCFPDLSTVSTVERKCATTPPAILKDSKTILYASITGAIWEAVRCILYGPLRRKKWCRCAWKRFSPMSHVMRPISGQ